MRLRIWVLAGQLIGTVLVVLVPLVWSDSFLKIKSSSFPYVWYWEGNQRNPNFPAIFLILGLILSVVMQITDKKLIALEVAKNVKGVVTEREFLEAYSATVSSTIESVRASSGMNPEQLEHARKKVLKGIRAIVDYYYDKSEDLKINACYMLAYPTTFMPIGIEERLDFREKQRLITTYAHVLDLVMWAEDHIDLPKKLAIPVENPDEDELRFKLLPGAPRAFAMGETIVVPDTRDLDEYFKNQGKYVDAKVRERQLQFFKDHNFRSFVSFVLEHDAIKKGVLNVQSNEPFIFGKDNEHQKLVTELLRPMKDSLAILL